METIKGKTFIEVKEALKEKFVIKEDANLYLVTAKRDETEFTTDLHRGVILEKETNKVVFMCFKDRIEFDEAKPELSNYGLEWSNCQVEESIEGSQIRMYHYGGKWCVATSHCIDAHNSRWGGNNFYDLFVDAATFMNWDFSQLDSKYCHLLVMQHPKNVLVNEFTEPKLIHILSRDTSIESCPEAELDIGLPKPKIVTQFQSMEELLQDVNTTTNKDKEGYVIKDTQSGKRIKIMSKIYKEMSDLRMNVSSNNMVYHYLMLLAKDKVADYLKLYPKDTQRFQEIEVKIEAMIEEIFQQYIRKFKLKVIKMSDVFYPFRPFVYELNGLYLKSRVPINRQIVRDELFKKASQQIAFIYHNYFQESRMRDKLEMDIDEETGEIFINTPP